MINAHTAILNYAESDADLVALIGTRIAARHKFGDGTTTAWPKPSKAVTLAQSGGNPDIDTPRQVLRLEARCYGERQREASRVYDALIGITRAFQRTVVSTGDGNALIYYLVADSGPDFQFDIELELNYIQVFIRAAVAEVAVP